MKPWTLVMALALVCAMPASANRGSDHQQDGVEIGIDYDVGITKPILSESVLIARADLTTLVIGMGEIPSEPDVGDVATEYNTYLNTGITGLAWPSEPRTRPEGGDGGFGDRR